MRDRARKGVRRDNRERLKRERDRTWLLLFEVGLASSRSTRPEPWPVDRIAEVFGLAPRTIYQGIATARRLREAVAHVARDN